MIYFTFSTCSSSCAFAINFCFYIFLSASSLIRIYKHGSSCPLFLQRPHIGCCPSHLCFCSKVIISNFFSSFKMPTYFGKTGMLLPSSFHIKSRSCFFSLPRPPPSRNPESCHPSPALFLSWSLTASPALFHLHPQPHPCVFSFPSSPLSGNPESCCLSPALFDPRLYFQWRTV